MAIYRPEQARLSFSSEPAHGAYIESTTASTSGSAIAYAGEPLTLTTTGDALLPAGTSQFTLPATLTATGVVGAYIQFGLVSEPDTEVRRIINIIPNAVISTRSYVTLDFPLGFYHNAPSISVVTASTAGYNYATFLPGVYESIQVPDLTPELMPKYFLKENNDRNWSYMYRGRQVFNGALGNVILLNGFPLRFALGKERISSLGGATATTSDIALYPGMIKVTVDDAAGFAAGDDIVIYNLAADENREVRKIIEVATDTLTLNLPLNRAYNLGCDVKKIDSATTYTHEILETGQLDSMTWNVLMNDSDSNSDNRFIRRFLGGVVNRATLSADEGGLLMFSWDDVQFLDFVHNQVKTGTNTYDPSITEAANRALAQPGVIDIERGSSFLRDPRGIGGAMGESSGALSDATYPENEPYYFSEGTVSFFGIEFARIRNFRLEINNNIDPRYYINRRNGRRGPSEFQEQFREYTMTAALAMQDSLPGDSTTRTMWKELILEGNYEAFGAVGKLQGFEMKMEFIKGNHKITIESPGTIANPISTTNQYPSPRLDSQGCFFRRATHNIEQEAPVQAEGEIVLRNLGVTVTDNIPVYP